MSVLSSIFSTVKGDVEAAAPAIVGSLAKAVASASPVAAEAITGIEDFLGTDLGKQVETWFEALFTHTTTAGAVVTVVPKATA